MGEKGENENKPRASACGCVVRLCTERVKSSFVLPKKKNELPMNTCGKIDEGEKNFSTLSVDLF